MQVGPTYSLDLVLAEIWNLADNDPRQSAPKIYGLVHAKAHDTSRKYIILHVRIPTLLLISFVYPTTELVQHTAQRRSKRLRCTLYLENSL